MENSAERTRMADTNEKSRVDIYAEIEKERAYQDKRWGVKTDDTLNTPWM